MCCLNWLSHWSPTSVSQWSAAHSTSRLTVEVDGSLASPTSIRRLSQLNLYSAVSVSNSSMADSATASSLLPSDVGRYIGELVSAHSCSDRADGLFSTVVVDEYGVALGLVYSSQQSLITACTEQRGVYWSRSRGSLWRKGESSGAVQHLIAVALDCDSDAIRFTVRQEGAGFCHLNRWTCWPHAGAGHGGLHALERTLRERRLHPQAGSYTNRLLNDGGLLNNKVLEEARELIEAATSHEVASEAADLLYFTSVLLCKSGVSLSEVERCLDLRSLRLRRRAGNAKPAGQLATNGHVTQNVAHSTIANITPATHVNFNGQTILK